MKRGGKVTRATKIIRAEQKVLQKYKAEVEQAVEGSETTLKARIVDIKAGRDLALAKIREGERLNEEAKEQKDQKD